MRKPDGFDAPAGMGVDGSHVAKALFDPATTTRATGRDVYSELSGRLADLVDDVRDVTVESDSKRKLLTLAVSGRDGVAHPARSLSDGTPRFSALRVLELIETPEVTCLEEPENGIHPTRIEAMISLLLDIAVDLELPVARDNPLRQVIIDTHSPGIVEASPDDSPIVAETARMKDSSTGSVVTAARFRAVPGTWRQRATPDTMPVFPPELPGYLEFLPRHGTASASIGRSGASARGSVAFGAVGGIGSARTASARIRCRWRDSPARRMYRRSVTVGRIRSLRRTRGRSGIGDAMNGRRRVARTDIIENTGRAHT